MLELDPAVQAETEETEWQNGQGEALDNNTSNVLQLAHQAVAKFPELKRRYQVLIGTAAVVSSAAIVLASIAISRRLHHGENAEKILAEITPEEIENAARESAPKPRRRPNLKSLIRH